VDVVVTDPAETKSVCGRRWALRVLHVSTWVNAPCACCLQRYLIDPQGRQPWLREANLLCIITDVLVTFGVSNLLFFYCKLKDNSSSSQHLPFCMRLNLKMCMRRMEAEEAIALF